MLRMEKLRHGRIIWVAYSHAVRNWHSEHVDTGGLGAELPATLFFHM